MVNILFWVFILSSINEWHRAFFLVLNHLEYMNNRLKSSSDIQIYSNWFLNYIHFEIQRQSHSLTIKSKVANSNMYTDQKNIIHKWSNLCKCLYVQWTSGRFSVREAHQPSKESTTIPIQTLQEEKWVWCCQIVHYVSWRI